MEKQKVASERWTTTIMSGRENPNDSVMHLLISYNTFCFYIRVLGYNDSCLLNTLELKQIFEV